jgi:hypothetical protein
LHSGVSHRMELANSAENRLVPDAGIVVTLEDSYGVKLGIIDLSLILGKISRTDVFIIPMLVCSISNERRVAE